MTDQSDDGLGLVEQTADEAWTWLCRGGWVLVEIGPDRAQRGRLDPAQRGLRRRPEHEGWDGRHAGGRGRGSLVTPARREPVVEPAAATPFRAWPSPISAGMLAEAEVSLSEVRLSGESTLWIEGRPGDRGRRVIVRAAPYSGTERCDAGRLASRTKVHEYGGGSFWESGEAIFFSNFADQRLYLGRRRGRARSHHPRGRRADPLRGRADRPGNGAGRVRSASVTRPTVSRTSSSSAPAGWIRRAVGRGVRARLLCAPRPSGDGRRLAWTCWDHPRMPWDGAELWVAEWTETFARPMRAAWQEGRSSRPSSRCGAPRTSSSSCRIAAAGGTSIAMTRTRRCPSLRWRRSSAGRSGCSVSRTSASSPTAGSRAPTDGTESIGSRCSIPAPSSSSISTPFSSAPWDTPQLAVEGHRIALIAGGPATPDAAVVSLDFTSRSVDVLKQSTTLAVDPAYISSPGTSSSPPREIGPRTHMLRPKESPSARSVRQAPAAHRDPGHGGPTAASSAELDLETQFWTTRGFAVVDVNYGGSTGYGRRYRERLKGEWGVVDVVDCIAAARHLAETAVVDGDRMAIRGGSAGDFTTLCALTFHAGVFGNGGATTTWRTPSRWRGTRKFESRYLDGLIGPTRRRPDCIESGRPSTPRICWRPR